MHIHSQLPFPSDLPPAFPMRPDHFHPSPHDPAVDFRTFYPYTPNEVKHRKRTTSAQLKILEDVFKRDTKPNAQLRNDLASQLEMTPRGVQVWFQNRRAKEKNKASKLTLSKTFSQPSPSPNDLSSAASPSVKEDPAAADELGQSPAQHESSPEVPDASATPSATTPPSPPQLQVITDPSNPSWNHDSADDLPPDSASSVVPQPNPFPASDLYAYRRGSLPVNAFPSPSPERDGPPSIDAFDPLARRRSVDASLQRLANNPYAPLARAKNGALFGSRYGVVPAPRYNIPGRAPYGQRPGLTNHATTSHFLDMRRSSVDPRAFRFSSTRGNLSPSPSPLSPYHGTRASLPDHSLYAVTSRPLISPIPGPLPSPHFSFGDASTPSMTSPSSGESERNSPDSLRSFPFRSDERDEDDRISSVSYDAYSRFGSIASIATSESSLHSAYYSDIGGTAVDAISLPISVPTGMIPGQYSAALLPVFPVLEKN
ncbi:hypothetical protein BDQ17DRAFT_1419854 [Cyathus striatus]|nr:hypothetical protein BDQ17DRAFT_1419854 [Cyathus striatus]